MACGDIDETNCWTGTARAEIASEAGLPKPAKAGLDGFLRWIQNRLFDVGSLLATESGKTYAGAPQILPTDLARLEADMDRMQGALKPLDSFCLPGGSRSNAALHHCRAVCRRAERSIVALAKREAVDPALRKFVNRLSDWFFVAARYAARLSGAAEHLWEYGEAATARRKAADATGGRAARKPAVRRARRAP